MNIKKIETNELYVFFHNMEDRGVNFFDIFLIGTDKKVTINRFLKTLHTNNFCSSLFMRRFYEKFSNKDDIYFSDNVIRLIMSLEDYSFEDSKDCFIYMLSKFVQINCAESSFKTSSFFERILSYMKKLNLDGARDIYEETSDIPLFYTSYKDVVSIPAFINYYTLSVERNDEDNILEELTEGVALNSCKKEDIEEILESLIDISDGLENTLVLKLKETLGL